MALKFRSLLAAAEHKKAQTYFLSKSDYENQLKQHQKGLLQLQRKLHADRRKLVILFEDNLRKRASPNGLPTGPRA